RESCDVRCAERWESVHELPRVRRPPTVVRADSTCQKQSAGAPAWTVRASRRPKERRPREALAKASRDSAQWRPARQPFVAQAPEPCLTPIAGCRDGSETGASRPRLLPIVRGPLPQRWSARASDLWATPVQERPVPALHERQPEEPKPPMRLACV